MSNTSADDLARIIDYVAGELPADEIAETERWVAEDPTRKALVDTLRRSQEVHRKSLESRFSPDRMVAGIVTGIAQPDQQTRRVRRTHTAHTSNAVRRLVRWASIGAGLAIVLGYGVAIVKQQRSTPSSEMIYTTRAGQIAHVTLDDGTRVTIAPNSSLRVARQFARRRDVALEGEAYFDVTQSSGSPFVVRTGSVFIRVLGTRFDVRRYGDDVETQVSVMSGKIALGNVRHPQRAAVTVVAGSLTRVADSTIIVMTTNDWTQGADWTHGALRFHGATVRDILSTIGHWYDYDFRVADSSLARRHLAVQFDGEPFDVVLTTLQTLLNVTMTFDGHVVTVTPRRDVPNVRSATPRTLSQPRMEVGL